jgi:hypothetical protein
MSFKGVGTRWETEAEAVAAEDEVSPDAEVSPDEEVSVDDEFPIDGSLDEWAFVGATVEER